jgi:hypothetical protein
LRSGRIDTHCEISCPFGIIQVRERDILAIAPAVARVVGKRTNARTRLPSNARERAWTTQQYVDADAIRPNAGHAAALYCESTF